MNQDSRVWYLKSWAGVDTQTISQCIKNGDEFYESEAAAWEAEVDRQLEELGRKETAAESVREKLAEARAQLMAALQREREAQEARR